MRRRASWCRRVHGSPAGGGERSKRGVVGSSRAGRLQRAGREAGGRVAVRQRQHGARQRLFLLAVPVPAALRDRHRTAK